MSDGSIAEAMDAFLEKIKENWESPHASAEVERWAVKRKADINAKKKTADKRMKDIDKELSADDAADPDKKMSPAKRRSLQNERWALQMSQQQYARELIIVDRALKGWPYGKKT